MRPADERFRTWSINILTTARTGKLGKNPELDVEKQRMIGSLATPKDKKPVLHIMVPWGSEPHQCCCTLADLSPVRRSRRTSLWLVKLLCTANVYI